MCKAPLLPELTGCSFFLTLLGISCIVSSYTAENRRLSANCWSQCLSCATRAGTGEEGYAAGGMGCPGWSRASRSPDWAFSVLRRARTGRRAPCFLQPYPASESFSLTLITSAVDCSPSPEV